jgi:DNA repair exonuclease SbcCD nuclease subunit
MANKVHMLSESIDIIYNCDDEKLNVMNNALTSVKQEERSEEFRGKVNEFYALLQLRDFFSGKISITFRDLAYITSKIKCGPDILKFSIGRFEIDSEIFHTVLNALYLMIPTYPENKRRTLRTKPYKILHLSDLHFGPYHRYYDKKYIKIPIDDRPTLLKDLVKTLKRDKCEIDFLVISGDLTWQGETEEFNQALNFVNSLVGELQIEKNRCVIIPGNHDIKWVKNRKNLEPSQNPMLNYQIFYKLFYGHDPNEYYSIYSKCDDIGIIGLSSVLLEPHDHGIGYVGTNQLDKISAYIDQNEDLRIKIAVLHHQLVPTHNIEYSGFTDYHENVSITIDAQKIINRLLDEKFSLVLHGHQHIPFCAAERRPSEIRYDQNSRELLILGTPSASVNLEHIGDYGRNGFSIIEINNRFIDFKPYTWESETDTFFNRSSIREWLQI